MADPEKYKEILEISLKEEDKYLVGGSLKDKLGVMVLLQNIAPEHKKDIREDRAKIQKADYLQSKYVQEYVEYLEDTIPGCTVIDKDKHISKDVIFLSFVARAITPSGIKYSKHYVTNRNGKSVVIAIVGDDKNLVCATADTIFNTIEYLN